MQPVPWLHRGTGTDRTSHQAVLRFSNLFDHTSQMFSELSKALPRFQAYAEIFHTPQLHRALREIYEGFVDFCFRTIEVLQSHVCCTCGAFATEDPSLPTTLANMSALQMRCYGADGQVSVRSLNERKHGSTLRAPNSKRKLD